MRLLRESKRSLHRSGLILADSSYQGLDKICFQAKHRSNPARRNR
ncbi:Putative uncharacterized protein [Lactobacillus helveticus CIRM-BIA 951]|uniref:Uncharacterized protein n=1 Tax=Lactobacillus helveticus CIRM-BIA 951 TaxID=1226334 RepID=U6F8J9_LACHE|nr:Putative uncharacterized protein [Lactobacillus helveticus CIRM-BIA 951]